MKKMFQNTLPTLFLILTAKLVPIIVQFNLTACVMQHKSFLTTLIVSCHSWLLVVWQKLKAQLYRFRLCRLINIEVVFT